MRIPSVDISRIELNEPNAALHKATREQAAHTELGAARIIQTVQRFRRGGLARQVDGVRGRALHAIGEFIRLNSSVKFRIGIPRRAMAGIQRGHEVQHAALIRVRQSARRSQIKDGTRASAHHRPLITRRQKSRAISRRPTFDSARRIGQNDECRQVLIFGSQAVSDPTSQAGLAHENRAGIHLIDGLRVVDTVRPARANHRQVIDATADMWQEIGNLRPALTASAKRSLRGEQRIRGNLPARRHGPETWRQRLSGEALQLRLRIKRFQMTRPAVHEQRDDPLGLRGKMTSTGRQRILGRACLPLP